MKLLREYYQLCEGGVCQDLLTEEEKRRITEEDVTILTGVMQCANKLNGNGRVYSKDILQREVKSYNEAVKGRRALGELDHPDSSVVNLSRCSHIVTEIWMDGDEVMGKIEVLKTPCGNILESLIKAGVPCGISSRGMGSIREENGQTIVEDDFQLICFDIVSDPSTPGAFMMQEALDLSNPHASRSLTSVKQKINKTIDSILNKIEK